MGQVNTKDQSDPNFQNGSDKGLAIQSAPTFDSHFTLISPKSDLSDPSKFFYKPPETTKPQLIKGPAPRLQRNNSQVIFQNMPQIPPQKKKEKTPKKKLAYNKKKKGARQVSRSGNVDTRTKTQRVKDAFAGCIVASSEQAQKMKDASNNIAKITANCSKKSEDEWVLKGKTRDGKLNDSQANVDACENAREERKRASLSTAAKSSLGMEPEKPKHSLTNRLDETVTPLAQLDTCFKKLCIHHEEDYFDRLTGPSDPTPSPVANVESDLQNSTNNVNETESATQTHSSMPSTTDNFEGKKNTSRRESSTGHGTVVKHKKESHSLQKSSGFFQISADQRRKSTESHKLRVATSGGHYRNIALCKSEGDSPERAHQINPSPTNSVASSTMSSVAGCAPGALVGDQALSNAAFLFSPSYAGGKPDLLKREKKYRDPAFSISTFASRARLSTVSSRSQPSVTIPVSKSWESRNSIESASKQYDFSGINSGDTTNSKQVRFSQSNDTFEIQKSSKRENNLIQEIETPAIEMKLSDLTESSVSQNHTDIANEDIASVASTKNSIKTRILEGDNASATSSEGRESIHWAYREEDGKITTTPKLGKKWGKNGTKLSKSPALRYHAAKAKFSVSPPEEDDRDFAGINDSDDSSGKQVRFSDSNETCNSVVTEQMEQIDTASIERKMSDLTEVTISQHKDEASVGTTASSLSQDSSDPQEGSIGDCQSETASHQEGSIHWTYREQHGKVTATPMKKGVNAVQPATSPLKRFNAARNKFSGQSSKIIPTKKTPPQKFANRTTTNTLVSSRISELRSKLSNDIHQQTKDDTRHESVSVDNCNQETTSERESKVLDIDDAGAPHAVDISVPEQSFITGEDGAKMPGENSITEESIATTDDLFTSLLRSETNVEEQSVSKCQTIDEGGMRNCLEQAPRVDGYTLDQSTRFANTSNVGTQGDAEVSMSTTTTYDVFDSLLRSKTEDDESVAQGGNTRWDEPEKKDADNKDQRLSSQYPGRPAISGEDELSDLVKVHDDSLSIAESESSSDPFAGVLRSNYDINASASSKRISTGTTNSVFSFATSSTNRASLDSYTDDKENASHNAVHKITSGGHVNPVHAYHPENPSNLCLSPTQRTPMQARKWRTLAAASTDKQNKMKGMNNRKRNKGRRGLQERAVN